MPAQQLTERSKDRIVAHMGLPANSSTAALMKKVDDGGLDVEFKGGNATSGHVTTRQWITVGVLVYVNLINYMDRLTIAGILDDVKKEFNANNAMGGLLQTAFIVSYMIFAPLFGYLGDRYSRKAIMAAGVFLWSIFTLIGSFMSGRPEHLEKQWGNPDFWAFLGCRAMVGIGEASYSTIAPTIISDMFVKDMRSKMLALFYFAIPVGSGLGYIVGSETAKAFGHWQWGLRATPVAGIIAVVLILVFLMDPPRGESEGHQDMQAQTYKEDIVSLAKNRSFVFSTLAFTCVTFCTGALSWWGPIYIADGLKTMKEEDRGISVESVPFIFGAVTMTSGIVGVPLGMILSTKLKAKYPRADPVICACGILISALFLTIGMILCNINIILAFVFLFIGEVALNLNWSIVADMLLYIVSPTCRSTAEAIQILASHTFGDAGSPYLIGLVSDGLFDFLKASGTVCAAVVATEAAVITTDPTMQLAETTFDTLTTGEDMFEECTEEVQFRFESLQYSLFSNCGVEVVGGILFLITAIYIAKDKLACENSVSASKHHDGVAGARLMMTPTNYSPEDSQGDEMPSDDEEMPKLKLLDGSEISSSRSPSPV
eukprot:TRINITY_DN1649_c0_g1_i1.p1 TRINITY_DN1649_c0_g1~~TRINITY_DN1649_c0_g1_i1.p1  ORF type:complete len:601 (-),score=174.31 TRINITY_DN1649_c0_g1_i1:558-2360(-)